MVTFTLNIAEDGMKTLVIGIVDINLASLTQRLDLKVGMDDLKGGGFAHGSYTKCWNITTSTWTLAGDGRMPLSALYDYDVTSERQ